ncbi:heat-inducible transcription repressor HrcA [Clostridia bacterium]|nr:heat-inducible transcription repressor HrcA [Clostridia bacterium]
MDLDERKKKILNAIIKNYLETGEPVGSRTISKYSDLALSSATIRNEMSDLEELGYIMQPHTSAGRIPSDKGYRFFVDQLMMEKDREVSKMQEFIIERTERMEQVLKQVVRTLATNTNYATMITAPSYGRNRLKFIQLSQVDEEQLLAIIVLEGNIVKNRILTIDTPLDSETLLKLNFLLNTSLNGLTVEEINLSMIAKLKEQAGNESALMAEILDAVAKSVAESEDLEVYTGGVTNIFKYPELSRSEKASELILALEEKQQLAGLARQNLTGEEETGIQVYIGDESPLGTMTDCSIVTANYELGEGLHGTIGIIGPKRMDYENVVDNLKTLKRQLDLVFRPPKE